MGKVIDRGLAGPDHPIYKGGLRVSSVLGPSALIANSPNDTDGIDPMQGAADQIERFLAAKSAQATAKRSTSTPAPSRASTTRSNSENS